MSLKQVFGAPLTYAENENIMWYVLFIVHTSKQINIDGACY